MGLEIQASPSHHHGTATSELVLDGDSNSTLVSVVLLSQANMAIDGTLQAERGGRK